MYLLYYNGEKKFKLLKLLEIYDLHVLVLYCSSIKTLTLTPNLTPNRSIFTLASYVI
jgi:hypothetical protein